MKRPSFQFYPADWLGNTNLRRCTHAERGIWLAVMCLMHDSDEYGLLRWPLRDIASAVNCKTAELASLAAKGVLKGCDAGPVEPYVYTPRHGRKDGPAVALIEAQAGPLWFCSRMVRDEYVRQARGESSRFGAGDGGRMSTTPKAAPKAAPKPPFGDGSTSSSTSTSTTNTPQPPKGGDPDGFAEFWKAWPDTLRKQDRKKCAAKWKRAGFGPLLPTILAHIDAMKATKPWREGFEPAPLTYLNGERWADRADDPQTPLSSEFEGCI